VRAALAILACLALASEELRSQRGGTTGGVELARAYEAVFDARFEALPALLATTCPPTPMEGCQLLDVVALLWEIQLDPHNPSRDAAFRTRADAAIAALDAWTRREPARAEAWFYLGGAYGARAQWRVLRSQTLAAAQDGKRIKEALERALALDPELQDAYFGIGLYHYYADVAPAAAKMLRWLLLLPGGDKTAGMSEMLRARSAGQLLRSEADYQLHLIYLWYEKQTPRALELLRSLRDRHPRNPHFPQLIAEIEDAYLKDHAASLRTWQALLDAAREDRVEFRAMTEARARLGVALQLYRLGQHEAALPHLRAVIDARPQAPYGAVALAQLQRGYALDRLGQRDEAVAAYRAALAANPAGDPLKIAPRARSGLRTPAR
jgi:tetratricopeptide (TPR) repeat protein